VLAVGECRDFAARRPVLAIHRILTEEKRQKL
jgi:hypothetical protein